MTNEEAPLGKFVAVGDYQMHYLDIGEGEPTMFLHGGGPGANGWCDFEPCLPYFTDRRVLLPDLIMYGRSTLAHHSEPMQSFHARCVDQFMEALGIESANFVCSSVGGGVAMAIAVEYPKRVKKIVLSGTTPTFEYPGREPGVMGPAQLWTTGYYGGEGPTWEKMQDLIASVEYYDRSLVPDHVVTIRYNYSNRPEYLALYNDTNNKGKPQDLKPYLPKVNVPVLMLTGKQEIICPPEHALWLASQMPDCDVYAMERTRHHPEEERPKDYAKIVKTFLELRG